MHLLLPLLLALAFSDAGARAEPAKCLRAHEITDCPPYWHIGCFGSGFVFLLVYDAIKRRLGFVEEDGDGVPNSHFYWEDRSYERFVHQFPTGRAGTFQHHYSSTTYQTLFRNALSGVLGRTWRHAMYTGLWAGTLEWALFTVRCLHNCTLDDIVTLFYGVVDVKNTIQPVASFLLALYVNGRMKKHVRITEAAWDLRGHLLNICLIWGSVIGNHHITDLKYKFKLYRYITLCHFWVYTLIVDGAKHFDEAHWVKRGLLTPEEAEILQSSSLKLEVVVGWLADMVTYPHAPEKILGNECLQTCFLDRIVEVRSGASALCDECSWLPPVSQPQLLTLLVEFFLMIAPLALVIDNFRGGCTLTGKPVYLWSMTGAFFTALFFKGLLNLVSIVEDPWGEDLDDLNEECLLVGTEEQTVSFLLQECPTNSRNEQNSDIAKADIIQAKLLEALRSKKKNNMLVSLFKEHAKAVADQSFFKSVDDAEKRVQSSLAKLDKVKTGNRVKMGNLESWVEMIQEHANDA